MAKAERVPESVLKKRKTYEKVKAAQAADALAAKKVSYLSY